MTLPAQVLKWTTDKGDKDMPENMENINQAEVDDEPMVLEVQVVKASPMIRAALEFYSMRRGVSIAEYCQEAVLGDLQMDEDSGNGTFDPGRVLTTATDSRR